MALKNMYDPANIHLNYFYKGQISNAWMDKNPDKYEIRYQQLSILHIKFYFPIKSFLKSYPRFRWFFPCSIFAALCWQVYKMLRLNLVQEQ